MAHIIQLRGGTASEAASANPILHEREIGVETDTQKWKIGDGATAWDNLPYAGQMGPSGGPIPTGGDIDQLIVKSGVDDFNVRWDSGADSKIDSDMLDGEHGAFYRPKVARFVSTAGYWSFIVQMEDGRLFGQQGNSATSNRSTGLVPYSSTHELTEIPWRRKTFHGRYVVDAASNGVTTWILFDNGELRGVGSAVAGQLGQANTTDQDEFVSIDTGVTRMWAQPGGGYNHTHSNVFWEKEDGTIWACGHNGNGHLGIGNTTNQTSPVQLTFFDDKTVDTIYPCGAYNAFTIATTTDGNIYGCGYNGQGVLGLGNTTPQTSWQDITSAWGGSTLGSAGAVLGVRGGARDYNGSTSYSSNHLLIWRADGSIRTCGENAYGQIGNGTTTDTSTPHVITGLSGTPRQVVTIGGGYYTSIFVVCDDDTLWRWGCNVRGMMGDGSTTTKTSPYWDGLTNDSDIDKILNTPMTEFNSDSFAGNIFIKDTIGRVRSAGDGACYTLLQGNTVADVYSYTRSKVPEDTEEILQIGSAEGQRNCIARTSGGELYIWGDQGNQTALPWSARSADIGTPIPIRIE